MRADQNSAIAEYAGVEQRRHGDQSGVVGAVETHFSQIAAVARQDRGLAYFGVRPFHLGRGARVVCRAEILGDALAGGVVAVTIDETLAGALFRLQGSRREQRNLPLRERQFRRLGVGGSEGQVEEFEFQVSSFDCGIRLDYIPQCRQREESPPARMKPIRPGKPWVTSSSWRMDSRSGTWATPASSPTCNSSASITSRIWCSSRSAATSPWTPRTQRSPPKPGSIRKTSSRFTTTPIQLPKAHWPSFRRRCR